jgi:hypothetical protein
MAERPRQDLKLRGSTDTSVALADILKRECACASVWPTGDGEEFASCRRLTLAERIDSF